MANVEFNQGKGRIVELVYRVMGADPVNCALVLVVLKAAALVSDAVLIDYQDLSQVLAGASDEATNAGYARKVLTAADGLNGVIDYTNDWVDIDADDQTWANVAAAGGAWGALLWCFDPDTTGGTDGTIEPLAKNDFAITPDGTNINLVIPTGGWYRAR